MSFIAQARSRSMKGVNEGSVGDIDCIVVNTADVPSSDKGDCAISIYKCINESNVFYRKGLVIPQIF